MTTQSVLEAQTRKYLEENFVSVEQQPDQGNYLVFSVKVGEVSHKLYVNHAVEPWAAFYPQYLNDYRFAEQLRTVSVTIAKPLDPIMPPSRYA